jgi:hypothetical protein
MEKELELYDRKEIENRIFSIRSIQVMIDRELAEMYSVETKVLNQAVKRNIERFPISFRFQLTLDERDELVTNCDRLEILKHSSALPYAFTEQGVAMLSAILRSKKAVQVSIQIINAFVEMRQLIGSYAGLLQRMDRFELKQAEQDQRFEQVFKALEGGRALMQQGVFFDGQTFDAYTFAADIIRSAKISIQLIDNYIDDSVLLLLTKRMEGVSATIYTKAVSKMQEQDIKKHNDQYEPIELKIFSKAHDRFLIIDENIIYHIGASLKDLGKKWFAFSMIEKDAVSILERVSKVRN